MITLFLMDLKSQGMVVASTTANVHINIHLFQATYGQFQGQHSLE